jgi:cathepsin L
MARARVATLFAFGATATPNYRAEWKSFQETYGKSFGDEEESRFQIFKANLDLIEETNAQNLSYKLGVNEFAHLTWDEFKEVYMRKNKPERTWGALPYLGTHNYSGAPLKASVDWTTSGAVTPVKNQGQCGSCWAFSTTGSLEGAWQIATGHLVSLSEQQFVDCDHIDQGCNGGLMDNGFKYAESNSLCTESSYPYLGRGGTCKATSCTVGIPKGDVSGYKDVSPKSTEALMEAVAKQPVSIAIEADKPIFQLYKSGVLKGSCGSNLDHGVLVVGYGESDGSLYWKVKNSWGVTWGEEGFIRLKRMSSTKHKPGECGLLSQPSYPVVSDSEVINV